MEGHCTPQGLFALCAQALQQHSASVPKLVVVWEEMLAGHSDKNKESLVPFFKEVRNRCFYMQFGYFSSVNQQKSVFPRLRAVTSSYSS